MSKTLSLFRICRINTPILIFGRETDHQRGIFKLTYEWLMEAGKDAQRQSFDHSTHGYVFIYNRSDGSFKPDETQAKAFETAIDYFDKHLKHSHNDRSGSRKAFGVARRFIRFNSANLCAGR
jgi:hypothetical protein